MFPTYPSLFVQCCVINWNDIKLINKSNLLSNLVTCPRWAKFKPRISTIISWQLKMIPIHHWKKTLLENYKQHSFICKQSYWNEVTFPAVLCPLWGNGDIISTVGSMAWVIVQVCPFHLFEILSTGRKWGRPGLVFVSVFIIDISICV